jgi:site-specific DNA-methyltransferase (adenine-specific)/site-specific DNA-methyltransferase (cytosine-N4-specific)
MAEFGDLSGITYNLRTGELVAGHQRMGQIRQRWGDLAIEPLADDHGQIVTPAGVFPVRFVDWPKTKQRAANIAANSPEISGQFTDALFDQLAEIKAESPDLYDGLLFASLDQDQSSAPIDEDTAPEPQIDVVTRPGDLWTIDQHKLICGDCRDAGTWERLLGGERVNVAMTSPPYASQRKYDESSGFKPIPPDEYVAWWEPLQAAVKAHLADDGSFFVNIKPHCEDGERVLYVFDLVLAMKRRWGWRFVDELCWKHSGIPAAPQGRFKNQFEPVYQFAVDAHKFRPNSVMHESGRAFINQGETQLGNDQGKAGGAVPDAQVYQGLAYPGNVVAVNVDSHNGEGSNHSAAFPVGLPSFFYRAFSDPGDICLDPFMGSGTSLMAAAQLGRVSRGIEISGQYCDVVIRRYRAKYPEASIVRHDGVKFAAACKKAGVQP